MIFKNRLTNPCTFNFNITSVKKIKVKIVLVEITEWIKKDIKDTEQSALGESAFKLWQITSNLHEEPRRKLGHHIVQK